MLKFTGSHPILLKMGDKSISRLYLCSHFQVKWDYAALAAMIFIVSTSKFADARPATVISGYPAVPPARTNSLVCYMRTQKGATLDLGRLCGDHSTPMESTIPINSQARRAASLPGGTIPRRASSSMGGYGAIAFSPSTKQFGYIGPRFTQAEAETQAKRACGRKDCAVGLSFRNTCGAFALLGNKPSYAKAGSKVSASQAALRRAGNSGKVIVSFCSRQTPTLL